MREVGLESLDEIMQQNPTTSSATDSEEEIQPWEEQQKIDNMREML
jgi:hypothetical protein